MLVDSLVMIRRNTPSFCSSEKSLVEYFLKRRLTISSLGSLFGSITPAKFIALGVGPLPAR